MPVRTASLNKRIAANGQALHRAMLRRIASFGTDHEPSEAETALVEERRLLKEERDKVRAAGPKRRPSALQRLVRTHHPEAKAKPKAKKEHAEKTDKKPHKSRADKHAEKAAALEAARKPKKPPAK